MEPDSVTENAVIEGKLSPPSMVMLASLQQGCGGDRLSTGSTVVDGEGAAALQMADSSGDSYFQESLIEGGGASGCIGQADRTLGSEEDGCTSDDGCSYFPGDIFQNVAHGDNWWVWN